MKAKIHPLYTLREQEPYCCVPTCVQMVLSRRELPLFSQEEIGLDLGLIVPPEIVDSFQNVPTGEMPPAGYGTRINLDQYNLNNFFKKRNLPLKSTYSTLDEIDNVTEYIAENISIGSDILICFKYGVLYDNDVPHGHGSLIETIDGSIITLADPHGVRKKASVDNLVISIDQHRKEDMLLGGFWLIE